MGRPTILILGHDPGVAAARLAALQNLLAAPAYEPPAGTDPEVYRAWTGHYPIKIEPDLEVAAPPDAVPVEERAFQELMTELEEFGFPFGKPAKPQSKSRTWADSDKIRALADSLRRARDLLVKTHDELATVRSQAEKYRELYQREAALVSKQVRRAQKADLRPIRDVLDEYIRYFAKQGGPHGMPGANPTEKRRKINEWIDLLKLKTLQDIDRQKFLQTINAMKLSPNTVWNRARALTGFCRWAADEMHYMPENPLASLRIRHDPNPKPSKDKGRCLSEQEVKKLLTKAPPKRRLWYQTALQTGIRGKAMYRLTVADLIPERQAIRVVRETNKRRVEVFQAVTGWLWKKLLKASKGRSADDSLLRMPYRYQQKLNDDLDVAKIPKTNEEGAAIWQSFRKVLRTRLEYSCSSKKIIDSILDHSQRGDVGLANYARLDADLARAELEKVSKRDNIRGGKTATDTGSSRR
jgi:hypothetical protein